MQWNIFDGKRVLAIVPHQDDEVIGMGGQVAYAAMAAASLQLVLVTDGAADGGAKSLGGEWPCARFCDVADHPNPELEAHDATLRQRDDGTWWHCAEHAPPFEYVSDPERAPGFACPAWGKQRDFEFIEVAQALGVPRENITLAYWDPAAPERIKDGQTARGGKPLTGEEQAERYARVAAHYFAGFRPDIVITMAPYEFLDAPNDHWAIAHGVRQAASAAGIERVLYNHSGMLYRHIQSGGGPMGEALELPALIWDIKRRALRQYLRWNPAGGWFATAAHSVAPTFQALLSGAGRIEYISMCIE